MSSRLCALGESECCESDRVWSSRLLAQKLPIERAMSSKAGHSKRKLLLLSSVRLVGFKVDTRNEL